MLGKILPTIGLGSVGFLAVSSTFDVPAAASAVQPQASMTPSVDAVRCAQLVGKRIGGARIDKADFLATGSKMPLTGSPASSMLPSAIVTSPADFCRVDARITPVEGSEIKIQVWLPANWNGKFVGVGGGGFEGGYASAFIGLRRPLSAGYAGVATNAGHDPAPEPKWVLESPEKLIDYGHRANHLGAVAGKAIVARYYGRPAERAYFQGCSNGGRDALMLAQRYPDDYDAIAAGAPANDFTALMTFFAHAEQLVRRPGIDLSAAKLKLVHEAAVKQCDVQDGAKDGLIERPSTCTFDPAVLQCKSDNAASCLSKAELGFLKAIYRGTFTRAGHEVMPGLPPGSEYEWANWLTAPKSAGGGFVQPFFGYMVYRDPTWSIAKLDLDRDYAAARERVGPTIDAVDPDLRPFLSKGGRLLMYHGWDDAAIPAGNTLRYYSAMKRKKGQIAHSRTRLFMLPGVGHCAGGVGPDIVDYIGELDRWSESGVAPSKLVATKYDDLMKFLSGAPVQATRTHLACPWQQTAHYKGKGSVGDAANFVCR